MTNEELKKVHKDYENRVMKWKFYRAAYGGATELVEAGFIQKHERESAENYNKRVAEAYGFSYSRSIVDLISYYLFKCPPQFRVGFLAKDPLWQLFVKDCNLRGEELDEYLVERQSAENYNKRVAEAYGFSYSRSIVDLISYYLFKCPPQFRVGFLAKDPLWQLFVKDCNLRGE